MSLSPIYSDWTPANGDSIAQLTAITGAPGHLWPYPTGALPNNIAKGFPTQIRDCFISGYVDARKVEGHVEAIGELLVTRDHETPESGKAYIFVVAVDDHSTPYFRGPFKPVPQHYYNQEDGVPIDKLFGRVDLNDLGRQKV